MKNKEIKLKEIKWDWTESDNHYSRGTFDAKIDKMIVGTIIDNWNNGRLDVYVTYRGLPLGCTSAPYSKKNYNKQVEACKEYVKERIEKYVKSVYEDLEYILEL